MLTIKDDDDICVMIGKRLHDMVDEAIKVDHDGSVSSKRQKRDDFPLSSLDNMGSANGCELSTKD